jgi:hypothetical protein
MSRSELITAALVVVLVPACTSRAGTLDGFESSPHFGEQVRTLTPDDGVRVLVNAAGDFDAKRPTHLVIFALPNGNTIEQTMGCVTTPGMDWHFDIQHVAAQVRLVRTLVPDENVVVAAVEANTKSWPAWRKARPDNPQRIRKIVDAIAATLPADRPTRITLTCHSGGGSFLFGFIDGGDAIPPAVTRVAWLDANYSYDDPEKHHGDKLLAWLAGDPARHLVVIAYDDREITLNGKKVVSDTGGTFRASHRMLDRFRKDLKVEHLAEDLFDVYFALHDQVLVRIHKNPDVKILHTVLVERNGLVEALVYGTPADGTWNGTFWGDRAYKRFIQPAPNQAAVPATKHVASIPPRPDKAPGGRAFAESIDDLPAAAREAAIVQEILRGNVPDFLRKLVPVTLKAGGRTVVVHVMPDYLAVGSDEDFLRVPMTPASARRIADPFGFTLPTPKIVDAVYASAEVKLEPRPLTEHREATETFAQHNAIIEGQRAGKPLGVLVAGHKKDVLLSNKLLAKPNKVAIYGWHKLDGRPIQPEYAGHVNWYVDYSHGIRLVSRKVKFDGNEVDLLDLLAEPSTCSIVGGDDPIRPGRARYEPVP